MRKCNCELCRNVVRKWPAFGLLGIFWIADSAGFPAVGAARCPDFVGRLNRHISIVVNSDRTNESADINRTKERVRDEFDKGPGFDLLPVCEDYCAWRVLTYCFSIYDLFFLRLPRRFAPRNDGGRVPRPLRLLRFFLDGQVPPKYNIYQTNKIRIVNGIQRMAYPLSHIEKASRPAQAQASWNSPYYSILLCLSGFVASSQLCKTKPMSRWVK